MARKKEYSVDNGSTAKAGQKDAAPTESKEKVGTAREHPPNLGENLHLGAGSHNVYDVADLRAQLGSYGLTVRDIPGDGNCLFRALGDQMDGHTGRHLKHRLDTVRYMIAHRGHFEPFIDVPFEHYVTELSRPGTYAGQDALVAFSRLHEVNIVIHQLNRPLWKIEGTDDDNAAELHLSYHNGEHYSSVRRFGDMANTPAGVRIRAPAVYPHYTSHSIFTSTKPLTACVGSEQKNVPNITTILNEAPPMPVTDATNEVCEQDYFQNEDDFTNVVHEIMNRTGIHNTAIVTEALLDNGGDLDQAVDYLLSLAVLVESARDETNVNKQVAKRGLSAVRKVGKDECRPSTLPSKSARNQSQISSNQREQTKGQQDAKTKGVKQRAEKDFCYLTL